MPVFCIPMRHKYYSPIVQPSTSSLFNNYTFFEFFQDHTLLARQIVLVCDWDLSKMTQ